MNLDAIQKLFGLLPDGPKKTELVAKYNKLTKGSNGGGLHDTFEFAPSGHIRIEQIDDSGNVLGVLADQPNLVVKGAEEILLRAFSGDPENMLYKVRVPKALSGTTGKFHIKIDGISEVVDGVDQLKYVPNVYWKAVKEDDFTSFFSYRPYNMFIKEEVSDEVGKKAFTISKTPVSGSIPIQSELYSTASNMFIGLGDGRNYDPKLTDARFTFSAQWADDEGKKKAVNVGETITFNEKISNFVLEYEKSNLGGQIEVKIDNVLVETIETYDSNLTAPEKAVKEFKGLDNTVAHAVELKFSGADPSSTTPQVVITALRFDALSKDMTNLIHEFENFSKVFETATPYSTSTVPPYVADVRHKLLDVATVKVEYNGVKFERVNTVDEVAEGKFFVNAKEGRLHFNRALSGVLVTYNITGEQYVLKAANTLTSVNVERAFTNETPVGDADGTNVKFTLAHKDLVSGSVVVTMNDTVVAPVNYTVDLANGEISFKLAPDIGSVITVSYKSKSAGRKLVLPFAAKTVKVADYRTGKELTVVSNDNEFAKGKFKLDADNKTLTVSDRTDDDVSVIEYEVTYFSDEAPGAVTNYTRQVIEKPKAGTAYPWYQLDKGSVTFVAEFPESVPNFDVTIREMGLFNGPRTDDKIEGFKNQPVDAFSLVRVADTRKEVTTGIRVTWTITLVNNEGDPFKGGF